MLHWNQCRVGQDYVIPPHPFAPRWEDPAIEPDEPQPQTVEEHIGAIKDDKPKKIKYLPGEQLLIQLNKNKNNMTDEKHKAIETLIYSSQKPQPQALQNDKEVSLSKSDLKRVRKSILQILQEVA